MKSLLGLCLILIASPVFAEKLISDETLETLTKTFLSHRRGGPAPKAGSKVDKADVRKILRIQKNALEMEKDRAVAEAHCSLNDFFGEPYGFMTPEQVELSAEIYQDIFDSSDQLTNKIKDTFLRTRPALREDLAPNPIKALVSIAPRTSYPSGHTGIAASSAIVFSKIFPQEKYLLKQRAKEVGYGRILGGVHHPSDIRAAHLVGKLVAAELLKNKDFLSRLAQLCQSINPGRHCRRIK